MSQAFYRKYRSKKLTEIIGQEHITNTLSRALQTGNISHAYLFTGPRGVGKTSIARILAHEVNGLAYDEDRPHIDIIEIDAASNRRIDEVRDIRDKVHIAPTSAKYKVYIIDEVHMLTKEAFNALLKTLEEPPAHVIFILATTEAHKLPETIISRTQRFSFKPISPDIAKQHLATIAKQEAIKVDNEALELIADYGQGSFRDSISLLNQLASGEEVTADGVRSMLGVPSHQATEELYAILTQGNPKELMAKLADFRQEGLSPLKVGAELANYLRSTWLAGQLSPEINEPLKLLEKLAALPARNNPEEYLELALLGAILDRKPLAQAPDVESNENNRPSHQPVTATTAISEPVSPSAATAEIKQSALKPVKSKKISNSATTNALDQDLWDNVLGDLKKNHSTIYGIMRMSKPTLSGQELLLEFGFPFHHKQIDAAANRQKITTVVQKHFGQDIIVKTLINTDLARKTRVKEAPPQVSDIGSITNIFGGGEVLES